MSRYYGFPEYVPVAQKRAKAAKKLAELKKKNPKIKPVVIEGRSITSTWWGKSWNENLERYADYSNRIGRGRSYVRHGAVLDLQIERGEIRALVQGSRARPYKVKIKIDALDGEDWARIREAAGGQLDSLAELLAGEFPKPLKELFFARGKGLFPEPKEIELDCNCPDWAYMCKHVAATLYGVGARLDEDPGLFFKLRDVEVEELIAQAVKGTTKALLDRAKAKSSRVIEGADLDDIFGIKLDDEVDLAEGKPAGRGRGTRKGKVKVKAKGKAKRSGGRKGGVAQSAPEEGKGKMRSRKAGGGSAAAEGTRSGRRKDVKPAKATVAAGGDTMVDRVVAAFTRRRKGFGIADICASVDLSERQVRNAVARAVTQGRIEVRRRGIYFRP